MAAAHSLKEYLKRYESGAEDQKRKKKKKKEKPKSNSMGAGVLVVDEDPVWQKPVRIEDEDSDSAGEEETPQVDEDIEVKRMKRLEAIRSRKPYHGISEDGSGWVTILDSSKAAMNHSPPRQRQDRFDMASLEHRQGTSGAVDADLSPPQQRRRRADTEDADISPPWHRRRADTPSPEREVKPLEAEDADISPPRRRRRVETPSLEREGKSLETEDADISLPQRRWRCEDTLSPPRRQSSEDLSPPRRARKGSLEDLSPKGVQRQARHCSPGGRGPGGSAVADPSLPRRSKDTPEDLSPPRRVRHDSQEAVRPEGSPPADLSPPRKSRRGPPLAKEAPRAGLFSVQEFKEEAIHMKRAKEKSSFLLMDPSRSGKDAVPVFRNKEGKPISKEEILKRKEEEKPKEKKLEWGKGLAQKRDAEARAQELELEKDRPFARSRDDPEIDKMLKERMRWGDPMAHLVKRKNSDLLLEDFGVNEKMQESGFIIPQDIPSHSWIKRRLDCPPNRYGIRPGRHWDGVDRSNGYEKEFFKRHNEKRATEREAYLWSVSEM